MAHWLETIKRQILGEDRTMTWEGSAGIMKLAGNSSVERLLDEAVRLSKGGIDRSTRSLIFITTEVTVDKRCIAMASGVFKILKNES